MWNMEVVTIFLIVETEKESKLHFKKSLQVYKLQTFAVSTWKTIQKALDGWFSVLPSFFAFPSFCMCTCKKYSNDVVSVNVSKNWTKRRQIKMPPADFRHVPRLKSTETIVSLYVRRHFRWNRIKNVIKIFRFAIF